MNNASAFYPTLVGETTEAQWDELFASNAKAPYFRVIAQVESPADFGYRVRVGAVFPLETATGEVLEGAAALTRVDPLQAGITDVVAPIVDARGVTRAALTVPYVATTFSGIPVDEVVAAAEDTASEISRLLKGEPR